MSDLNRDYIEVFTGVFVHKDDPGIGDRDDLRKRFFPDEDSSGIQLLRRLEAERNVG